jgi:predicted small lipoprotein YifL
MSARITLRAALFGALLGAAVAGCGQRGPLVLPDDARPIQRLPPQPQSAEPESDEEDRRDER